MSGAAAAPDNGAPFRIPEVRPPRPCGCCMTEFWERFAFYGIRCGPGPLHVAQLFGGDRRHGENRPTDYGVPGSWCTPAPSAGGYVAEQGPGLPAARSCSGGDHGGACSYSMPQSRDLQVGGHDHRGQTACSSRNISTWGASCISDRRAPRFGLDTSSMASTGARFSAELHGWLARPRGSAPSVPPTRWWSSPPASHAHLAGWFWFAAPSSRASAARPNGRRRQRRLLYVLAGAMLAIPHLPAAVDPGHQLQWFVLSRCSPCSAS